jgi:putative ABC transport system permease protein
MIFGESGIVSLIGALTGLLIGGAFIIALKTVPALHGYVDSHVHAGVVCMVVVLAFFTGIIGAFYPAIYAMRVRAVEALRFE